MAAKSAAKLSSYRHSLNLLRFHHVFLQLEVVFEDPKRLSEIDQKMRRITIDRLDRQVGMVGDIGLANMIEMRAEFPKLFESYRIPFSDIGTIAGY